MAKLLAKFGLTATTNEIVHEHCEHITIYYRASHCSMMFNIFIFIRYTDNAEIFHNVTNQL